MTSEDQGGAETAALIAVGGFVGASLRHLVAAVLPGLAGTLAVNVLGSFVLGVLVYAAVYTGRIPDRTRTVLGTGLLSSFTTYSTFAVQTVQSPPAVLVGNVLANYALGFLGVLVARSLLRRRIPDWRGDRSPTATTGKHEPRSAEGGDP